MRSSSKSRNRGRNANRRGNNGGSVINRVFESAGPEGKVRGTPQQIIDKYTSLAHDSQLSGDRVSAENFQQHAEHYQRILSEAQKEISDKQIDTFNSNSNNFNKVDSIQQNNLNSENEYNNLPVSIRRFEPKIALTAGLNGLDSFKKIIKELHKYLNPSGMIFMEIGYNQKKQIEALFIKHGYQNINFFRDLSGTPRVVCVKKDAI